LYSAQPIGVDWNEQSSTVGSAPCRETAAARPYRLGNPSPNELLERLGVVLELFEVRVARKGTGRHDDLSSTGLMSA
jgi:hypothetical protein